ncbi:alpha/beta hydrolase [Flexivirga meconopsidis]|uniref:alpha/beta hydrolase n=1 Tax=Flexivirga meconopsidis TaxID=2977121 RepID=UPI00224017D7|nr:alpha/beta hydrolase-fold protein [Flexivirga meconopsidis]
MGPNGLGTMIALWLLTAGVVGVTVWFWQFIGERSIRGIAARLATQVAVIVCALAAATATLNHEYDWYVGWGEVRDAALGVQPSAAKGETKVAGAKPQPRVDPKMQQQQDDSAVAKFRATRVATERSLKLIPSPGPTGQYVRVTVPGLTGLPKGRRLGRVIVWLPASYTDPKQQDRLYPVIEGFHGAPGGPLDWKLVDHVEGVMAKAIADKKVGEPILVFPDYMPGAVDTECLNGGAVQMETWLTQTVPQWISAHFRVRTSSDSWATMGYSAGGWCSAMAALLHPDRYAASIVIGGYFTPELTNWNPFGKAGPPARYDLLQLAADRPPRTSLWLQVADADPTSGKVSAQLARVARPPLSVTTFSQPGVGHRISVFMAALPVGLGWLGKTLPAFAPARAAS